MSQEIEEKILKVFRESSEPIPAPVIRFLTKECARNVSEQLRNMERCGLITPVSKKMVTYYKLNGNNR